MEIKPHKIEEYQFIRSYDSNGFLVSGVNFTGPILISKEQTFNWDFKNKIETMTFSDVSKINEIQDIAIVWNYDDDNSGDINVEQIYNHETGEVYWENHDDAINWNDGDELILNSLLMYGDLESTIV